MLGEKIGEETGKVTVQRALASAGGGPRMETTFQATGSILGVGHKTTGTYASEMRPDGTLFGDGQGIVHEQRGRRSDMGRQRCGNDQERRLGKLSGSDL